MSSKDFQILQKLYKHTMAIMKYCAEYRTLEQFESNSMCVEATVFDLMQIGELAKASLSDEAKTSLSAIPRQQIYGLRNRIVHGYEGVSKLHCITQHQTAASVSRGGGLYFLLTQRKLTEI